MTSVCRVPKVSRTVARIITAAEKAGWDTEAECHDSSRPRDWTFKFTCRIPTRCKSRIGIGLCMVNYSTAHLLREIGEIADGERDPEKERMFRDFHERMKTELTKKRN